MCSSPMVSPMTRKVGMAQRTAQTVSKRPPRLLIVRERPVWENPPLRLVLLSERITRVMSTDAIREIMRAMDAEHEAKASTDPRFPKETMASRCSIGTKHASVEPGIAQRDVQGEKALICSSKAFIVPSARLLEAWEEAGGVALGVVMVVDEEQA